MNKTALIEAMLFTTMNPLAIEELEKISRLGKKDVVEAIDALKKKYEDESHGIRLFEAGGYKLVVKQEYMQNVSNLTPHADLSRGLLRVLSVIAYYQPISQADIVKVIGNRTYEYVRELTARGFVKKEKKSRTQALSTTKHFEEYFGARAEEIKKMAKEKGSGEDDE
ncbi:MAG TPA: SMC-Scp complex subunit ScpB [archaeon]|nr:SMC-Scp complex subunit ScpB [archaeon]